MSKNRFSPNSTKSLKRCLIALSKFSKEQLLQEMEQQLIIKLENGGNLKEYADHYSKGGLQEFFYDKDFCINSHNLGLETDLNTDPKDLWEDGLKQTENSLNTIKQVNNTINDVFFNSLYNKQMEKINKNSKK